MASFNTVLPVGEDTGVETSGDDKVFDTPATGTRRDVGTWRDGKVMCEGITHIMCYALPRVVLMSILFGDMTLRSRRWAI